MAPIFGSGSTTTDSSKSVVDKIRQQCRIDASIRATALVE
jgi:hypothetical protein